MFPSYIYKYFYRALPADMGKGGCKLYKICTGIENRQEKEFGAGEESRPMDAKKCGCGASVARTPAQRIAIGMWGLGVCL
jgi:hypothetical protein